MLFKIAASFSSVLLVSVQAGILGPNAPCMEPKPSDMGKCMISCETLESSPWNMELLEWDYDEEHDLSIYTYEATAMPLAATPMDAVLNPNTRFSSCLGHTGYSKVQMGEETTIDRISVLYDGCCDSVDVFELTQAVTPDTGFSFSTGGYNWDSKLRPGHSQCVGVMVHGMVNTTHGSFCLRGADRCFCGHVQVPDLCNADWHPFRTEDWAKSESSSSDSSSDSNSHSGDAWVDWGRKWNHDTYDKRIEGGNA